MNNENIVVIYKEVGKKPVFKKIVNTVESFEKLLGGEIDVILYEDIFIICRKSRENLRPNIYLNIRFGKIDSSVRGNLVIVNKDGEKFKSLTRQQLIKYSDFTIKESFKYIHFDDKGRYISTNKLSAKSKQINESELLENIKNKDNQNNVNATLSMILQIQTAILQFIKFYSN